MAIESAFMVFRIYPFMNSNAGQHADVYSIRAARGHTLVVGLRAAVQLTGSQPANRRRWLRGIRLNPEALQQVHKTSDGVIWAFRGRFEFWHILADQLKYRIGR